MTFCRTDDSMSDQHGEHANDAAYKLLFSHREMVASLLRDFVKEDFIEALDFDTLERYPDSQINRDGHERREDLIWRLRLNQGGWCYIYILLEFQSTPDPWMAVRILEYVAVLWRGLIRTREIRAGDCLPPVLPIVLYNGNRQWNAARDITELMLPLTANLQRYQPQQRYFLLDESRIDADSLPYSGSLTTLLLRLEQAKSLDALKNAVSDFSKRLNSPKYEELRRILGEWVTRVALKRVGIVDKRISEIVDLREVASMLEENALRWKDEFIEHGRMQGLAEGEAAGRMDVARNLISMGMRDEQIVQATGLALDEVRRVVAENTKEACAQSKKATRGSGRH